MQFGSTFNLQENYTQKAESKSLTETDIQLSFQNEKKKGKHIRLPTLVKFEMHTICIHQFNPQANHTPKAESMSRADNNIQLSLQRKKRTHKSTISKFSLKCIQSPDKSFNPLAESKSLAEIDVRLSLQKQVKIKSHKMMNSKLSLKMHTVCR